MKMWGGRFSEPPGEDFLRFTKSIGFDMRLYPQDIRCSIAYAAALAKAGILSSDEEKKIVEGLNQVQQAIESGDLALTSEDEDIHSVVERRLVEIIGTVGGKIRTGRSRNDQVATDVRLFIMDEGNNAISSLLGLMDAIREKAISVGQTAVPGYTHLQKAQPVLLAHHLLAYFEMFSRDVKRVEIARDSADCLPLGSGALSGSPYKTDRDFLAGELGFSRISQNSMDAVSDRDFLAEFLFALCMIQVHLSRLAEEMIMWCTSEFGWVELDDQMATGSSLMPQKKNPDAAELIRAKTGRVTADLLNLLVVLKGLPLTYNRDLQEDKEPLFDALDTVLSSLGLAKGMIETLEFKVKDINSGVEDTAMLATELADYLVMKGMDFPASHNLVGQIVAYCEEKGKDIGSLETGELKKFSDKFGPDIEEYLSISKALERRGLVGGTAPKEVTSQLAKAEKFIENHRF